jgi:hypothetical protein
LLRPADLWLGGDHAPAACDDRASHMTQKNMNLPRARHDAPQRFTGFGVIDSLTRFGPMRSTLHLRQSDLGRIFPMADVASARLMKIKARCLCAAGILPAALKVRIDRRANEIIMSADHPPDVDLPRVARPDEAVSHSTR